MQNHQNKIKVMIADDEYIAREDLKYLIDWESEGFEVVCEAGNGQLGIDLDDKFDPDVIITDIKMPIKDGLEMTEAILRKNPKKIVILLTAYDEFDYARTALKMNVSRYILKHELDEDVLLNMLRGIKKEIWEGHNKQKSQSRKLLASLIKGYYQENSNAISTYELKDSIYTLFVLKFSSSIDDFIYSRIQPLLDRLAQNNTEPYTVNIVTTDDDKMILLFEFRSISELFFMKSVSSYADKLSDALSEEFGKIIPISISSKLRNDSNIRNQYIQAATNFDFNIIHRNFCKIIWNSYKLDFSTDKSSIISASISIREHLLNDNFDCFFSEVKSFVDNCIDKAQVNQFLNFKSAVTNILDEYIVKNSCNISIDSLKNHDLNAFVFLDLLCDFADTLKHSNSKGLSKKMKTVVTYINSHFAEDISLYDISDLLNVNPVYMGQLFKKELGMTFKQYLTNVRIENAKKLLESGNYKIYEVGEMVGYQTTQYFSTMFRKVTGVNPREYLDDRG